MLLRRERGSVTAELVVALPAVIVVLAACLGGVRVGMQAMLAQDAAAVAARSAARGDGEAVAAGRAGAVAAGVIVTFSRRDGLVCASTALRGAASAVPISVSGFACALEGPV
jgi:hypothetical protein